VIFQKEMEHKLLIVNSNVIKIMEQYKMDSVSTIAEAQNIPTKTLREYLTGFPELFSDPVERDGIKVHPPEIKTFIQKMHVYY